MLVGRDAITPLPPTVAAPSAVAFGDWRLELGGAATILRDGAGRRLVLPDRRALAPTLFSAPAAARAVAAFPDASLLALAQGEDMLLAVADGATTRVRLGFAAARAVAAPDGRHILALDADGRILAVVDAALGRLSQAIAFDARVVHLAFLPDYGVAQRAGGGAWRFPLSSLAPGRALAMIEWIADFPRAPGADDPPPPFASADGAFLHLLAPAGAAIVRASGEAHSNLNAATPVAPTPIRIGPILAAVAMDRGWREAGPGRYVAPLRPTRSGRHALVVADYEGRFFACHVFMVGAEGARRERMARLALEDARSTVSTHGVSTLVFGVAGGSDDGPARGRVELMSLEGGWRGHAEAVRLDDGRYRFQARFPRSGVYVALPLFPGAAPAYATPLLVEAPRERGDASKEEKR